MNLLTRWSAAEPVRLYLYAVLVPALAVAIGYGLLTGAQAALWLALAAAVLGVPATEAARARVSPAATPRPQPVETTEGQPVDQQLPPPPAPRHRGA